MFPIIRALQAVPLGRGRPSHHPTVRLWNLINDEGQYTTQGPASSTHLCTIVCVNGRFFAGR